MYSFGVSVHNSEYSCVAFNVGSGSVGPRQWSRQAAGAQWDALPQAQMEQAETKSLMSTYTEGHQISFVASTYSPSC